MMTRYMQKTQVTPKINPCPKCGGEISIGAGCGGRGTGEMTSYFARCKCGFNTNSILGNDGTRKGAIREWNSICREDAVGLHRDNEEW